MAAASIPVDFLNPGQVFACMGFMEAAEILCSAAEGGFNWDDGASRGTFTLEAEGERNPVEAVIEFLLGAEVKAVAPLNSDLSTEKWSVKTVASTTVEFPMARPDSPATLPIFLVCGEHRIAVSHWGDGPAVGRDNVKFWAGAGGYPGAALARDCLKLIRELMAKELFKDPFGASAPQSSSFRFDYRRDYIPLDVGFSPNEHSTMTMVGYPLVEILAAIGMQHARPERPDSRNKLLYRYGVSSKKLPTLLARAVLGAQSIGFPMRIFRTRLGWPGQEGQARCIIEAWEEMS